MKYLLIILFLTVGIAAGMKTQYPAAPQVVEKEEPQAYTWRTEPIKITNQDLRRHADIVSADNPIVLPVEKISESTNSDQAERADNTKTKRIQGSELPTFQVVYPPNAEIHDLKSLIKEKPLINWLQKLKTGGVSNRSLQRLKQYRLRRR